MAGLICICECGAEFRKHIDRLLCPRCQAVEDQIYQNRPMPYDDVETLPLEFSRSAMRERHGVTGNEDV